MLFNGLCSVCLLCIFDSTLWHVSVAGVHQHFLSQTGEMMPPGRWECRKVSEERGCFHPRPCINSNSERKSGKRICIYMENRDQIYRMPLCLVHCLKLFCNMLGREGTVPSHILLPSPKIIFTVPCSPLFKDKSMQNFDCLRWASLETFQVVGIPLNTALFFPLRVPKLSPEEFASNLAKKGSVPTSL